MHETRPSVRRSRARFATIHRIARTSGLLLLLLLVAEAYPAAGLASPAEGEFRSEEGRFAVSLPCQPKSETRRTGTLAGTIELHVLTCQTESMFCNITWYDMPAVTIEKQPKEQILQNTCDAFIKGANLVEKRERRTLSLSGHPGREIVGEDATNGFAMIARYFLVEDRMYLVLAGVDKEEVSSLDADIYLSSFRLLK